MVFLADCQRWTDCYRYAGAEYREPALGDILLACEDALIAAQNTVAAAESMGIGSCYIGDVLENREKIVSLLGLSDYVLPATMVVFGFPTDQQKNRKKPARFPREFIVQKNRYRRLDESELHEMFEQRGVKSEDFDSWIRDFCRRKYMSDFAVELSRSVSGYLKNFKST